MKDRSITLLLLFGLGWVPVMAGGDEVEGAHSSTHVQIWLEEWRNDLPPSVSLIVPGGGLVNTSFPALSSDGAKIAIFYHAPHPMKQAYPTLDLYSTSSLQLQERIEFLQGHQQGHAPRLDDQSVLDRVRESVQMVNERLAQGGFESIDELFTFSHERSRDPILHRGKTITYAEADGDNPPMLTVTTTGTSPKELEIAMPVVPVIEGSEDPYNDCSVQGFPAQGWYEPGKGVLIIRIEFLSARDDCDRPEQWLIKRL